MNDNLAERIARQIEKWVWGKLADKSDPKWVAGVAAIINSELSSTPAYQAGLERGAAVATGQLRIPHANDDTKTYGQGWNDAVKWISGKIQSLITAPQPSPVDTRKLNSRLTHLAAAILKERSFEDSDPFDEKLRLWAIEIIEVKDAIPAPPIAALTEPTKT